MSGGMAGSVIQLLVYLILICLLAYLVVRYGLGRRFAFLSGRRMRVVEQLPLGPKAALTLVQVGHRYYLLAHQDGAVVVVREFEQLPEELPVPAGYAGQWSSPAADRLADWLEQIKEWIAKRRGRGK
ncbi:flagellar biosynthetic protein FliO [Desulfotomaculum copahuensis]|uniref:Flagellar protein n=1 Tax=Desulfotomaculum copahuensis TaxID=1838280 RepID=A0A1B7LBK8_9FIRM|nr:flagellar biosynthetic protein FliO [Desulfotomaculum copahuensis]OAT79926.1 flagellar biosynthetic protein FliO [Desulfotomaculum copahuensis]